MANVDWTNPGEAPYIIQIVTEPGYAQYTGNDDATREITAGSPAATAAITVDGAITTGCGGFISASLTASYVITAGSAVLTFPVQGGIHRLTWRNADTGADLNEGTGHTDVHGKFGVHAGLTGSQSEMNTIIRMDVTDTTLSYQREIFTPACVPAPPGSPGTPAPNAPPSQPQDVYVYSEDVHFSVAHPDVGQTITIFATIHYYGIPG